jgi:hypothetical protein
MEMEDQIRKNGRGGHSAALQRREVDGTTFYIPREGSTCTLGSMKSLKPLDSVISFDTCLADEVLSSERKRALLVAASGKICGP